MFYFVVFSLFTVEVMFHLAHIAAGAFIHKELLNNLLKLKLSFFEVTPIGRILSRFGKDIDFLDEELRWLTDNTIYCTGEVYIKIIILVIAYLWS